MRSWVPPIVWSPSASALLNDRCSRGLSPTSACVTYASSVIRRGRVILFEILAALQGMPIPWKGFCYSRAGESLVPVPINKLAPSATRSQRATGQRSLSSMPTLPTCQMERSRRQGGPLNETS